MKVKPAWLCNLLGPLRRKTRWTDKDSEKQQFCERKKTKRQVLTWCYAVKFSYYVPGDV